MTKLGYYNARGPDLSPPPCITATIGTTVFRLDHEMSPEAGLIRQGSDQRRYSDDWYACDQSLNWASDGGLRSAIVLTL